MSSTLRASTRAEHAALYEFVRHEITVGKDGRLHRALRSARRTAEDKPIQPKGRTTRFVMLAGRTMYAHEVAHVLRVGPDGPLIEPGDWRPVDGDWLNIDPDNWAIDRRPRGLAAREASLRARRAAAASRLVPDAMRPGVRLLPMTEARQRATYGDPRYWWARLSGAHGETVRELSTVWGYARDLAPRWWALSHHLARTARARLDALPPEHDKTAYLDHVRQMIRDMDTEALRAIRDASRWARITSEILALSVTGEVSDTPEQAAAVYVATTAHAADEDLY